MNIYFTASIRGGRDDQEIYKQFIETLRSFFIFSYAVRPSFLHCNRFCELRNAG